MQLSFSPCGPLLEHGSLSVLPTGQLSDPRANVPAEQGKSHLAIKDVKTKSTK